METWRLDKLCIKNFKYFYDEHIIDVSGKHLLIYGENGSGKSSVYWSLYTLLHSSLKSSHDDVKKYFDTTKDENLRNKNINNPAVDSYVSASWALFDENTRKVDPPSEVSTKIDLTFGLNESEANFTLLTARASDYINYKGLLRMFDFPNSSECDWFDAFVYDFFPYWKDLTLKDKDDNPSKNVLLYWNYLLSLPPTIQVNEVNKELKTSDPTYKFLKRVLPEFQDKLNNELVDIEQRANDILRNQFHMPVKLHIEAKNVDFNAAYQGHANIHDRSIHPPKIVVEISVLADDYVTELYKISHPASYFNEAKQTSIALAVRLSMMQHHLIRVDGQKYSKILCIDDLLVSLDMPNREKVISILLGSITDDFQILLFTHDQIFYNLVKEHIQQLPKQKQKLWDYYDVYATDTDLDDPTKSPIILKSESGIEKAKAYFRSKDFGSCGNYCRKECERILCEMLPVNMTLEPAKEDGTVKKRDLNGLITKWDELLKRCGSSLALATPNLQIYRHHVWNPLSHNDMESPTFKDELHKSIKDLEKLEQIPWREPGDKNYVGAEEGCRILFDHNDVSYNCKMKPLEKIRVFTINGNDYYQDIDVEVREYKTQDNAGVETPHQFDPAHPGKVTVIRISAVYKALLDAAGTDEATIGIWYTKTSVGKAGYVAIV